MPSDVGLATRERVSKSTTDLTGALEETGTRLELAARLLEDQFERASTSDKETMARLNDRKLVADLRAVLPESPKILARASAAVKERGSMNAASSKRYEKAFEQAFAELDRLKKLARKEKQ